MKSVRPRVAIVYDRVNKFGGAERVLETLFEIWPEAPLYTSVYNPSSARWADKLTVVPSYLQRLPWVRTRHELLAWAMPSLFESFDFGKFDIVISVTSAEAKGIVTTPETLHICYLLTPTRYLWSHTHFYLDQIRTYRNPLTRILALPLLSSMRRWDFIAAQRPDLIVPISKTIAHRVNKYYRRQSSQVIYPPVQPLTTQQDSEAEFDDYYLVVSRLVPYKRVDLAIKACNQLGRRLVIVGTGSQKKKLRAMAKTNTVFLGKVGDKRLANLYSHARALLFPGEEDFGIVCVESLASGTPVIAFNKGGVQEIIQNHITGVLFDQQQVKSVIKAIKAFEGLTIAPEKCKQSANRFSEQTFKHNFERFVEESWLNHLPSRG